MNNRMKMRSAVTLVLVALFVVTSVAVLAPMTVYTARPTPPPIVQVSTLDGKFCKATLHGTWKARTCTITALIVSSYIGDFAIPSKTTLAISAGEPGTIAGLYINSGFTITNYGVIKNSAGIDNSGTINNYATINNYGTIINHYSASIINNYGGIINNYSGGIINNSGSISNATFSGGAITPGGTINNCGTLNNYGRMDNCGTINNSGIINYDPAGVWYGAPATNYSSCQIP